MHFSFCKFKSWRQLFFKFCSEPISSYFWIGDIFLNFDKDTWLMRSTKVEKMAKPLSLRQKGQAKVEIIIPNSVVFQSRPFLSLSIEGKLEGSHC